MSKNQNIPANLLESASESKVTKSVLDNSLQFAKIIDNNNEQRIDELITYKNEIAELKAEKARLSAEHAALLDKQDEDHVTVKESGFLGTTYNRLNLNSPKLKDIVDKAALKELNKLKEENLALSNDSFNYERNISKLQNDNHVAHIRHREVIDALKYQQELDLEETRQRFNEKKRSLELDLKAYKSKFDDRLNDLVIDLDSAQITLIRLHNKLNKSWIFKYFNKNLDSLIEKVRSIKWNADTLKIA